MRTHVPQAHAHPQPRRAHACALLPTGRCGRGRCLRDLCSAPCVTQRGCSAHARISESERETQRERTQAGGGGVRGGEAAFLRREEPEAGIMTRAKGRCLMTEPPR
uniref:Uncharacterized protein n=1 Tax=Mustela putorius furo TaxID=9669 RepID=M3Y275_MUSPF